MAFPTLLNVIGNVAILVVGVPIVYVLSKALKLRSKPLTIAEPRKEATLAFLVIIAVFGATSAWHAVIKPAFQLKFTPFSHVNAVDILWVAFIRGIVLLPMIIAMKRTGQNLGSIGINGKDRWRMLALGFILSAVYITVIGFFAPPFGGGFTGFSPSLAYGLILFAIVGFVEEIVWRGYIQTRLVAYSGTLNGLAVTSLFFALWHFPKYYFLFSGVVLEALASALVLFPVGLVFGYIMLKSQNIIPSSIFHLFNDWNILFWQLPIS